MALRNFVRTKISRQGKTSWRLSTLDGTAVVAFDRFCEDLLDYPLATRKRYAEAASRFLDYLVEAGVFGATAPTAKRLNEVIEAYPRLLRDGSAGLIARIRARDHAAEDEWLVAVATALQWKRLKSQSNTLASINRFLSLSETLAREESERAASFGITGAGHQDSLITALDGHTDFSPHEVARMRQTTLLGGVAKFAGKGIRKAKRLPSLEREAQEDTRNKDFPLAQIPALLNAASCWRDRALWLLLAASGIRCSEALNLLLQDVDFDRQQVFVLDPEGRRFALPDALNAEPRFKGRTVAMTYLFPPLRQQFFEALRHYLENEFVPLHVPGRPQYLFQYVEPKLRGQPLVNASDAALNKPIKAAALRAGIPGPITGRQWTLHSLRHLYGVYMLNDYPIAPAQKRFGIPLTDVQMLMGHKSIRTTAKYARPKVDRVIAKLRTSDEQMLGMTDEERKLLPSGVLEHLSLK